MLGFGLQANSASKALVYRFIPLFQCLFSSENVFPWLFLNDKRKGFNMPRHLLLILSLNVQYTKEKKW